VTIVAMTPSTSIGHDSEQAIAAVLFDWDGTLLDSRAALLGAWHESTAEVLGRVFPATADEERMVFTLPGTQIWPGITHSDSQRETLIERFQQAYERTGELVRAFDGIPEALRRLRDAGIPTAVVTSKARRRLTLDARRSGLEDLIDVAVCSGDTDAAKPDPAPVLKAVELLGVTAGQALMAGDTFVDVEAGLRAGTAVVGVAWGASTEDELREAGARAVVRTPGELVALVLERGDDVKEGGR
jgi:HAD superfamily hydrolase (TIGR01509 family)